VIYLPIKAKITVNNGAAGTVNSLLNSAVCNKLTAKIIFGKVLMNRNVTFIHLKFYSQPTYEHEDLMMRVSQQHGY